MECIKESYPKLYTTLGSQYSVAVATLYRSKSRDIHRWADQGIYQLDAVSTAVEMVCLMSKTTPGVFDTATSNPTPQTVTPLSLRETQQFHAIPAMSVTTTLTPPPTQGVTQQGQAPTTTVRTNNTGTAGQGPPQGNNQSKWKPWPEETMLRLAKPGEAICEACNIPGHSPKDCRICDMERFFKYGQRSVRFFEICRHPSATYQHKLFETLKVNGALRNLEEVDQRIAEVRSKLEAEAADPELKQRNREAYLNSQAGRGRGGRGAGRGRGF